MIVARAAIEQLILRYGRCVDDNDGAAFAALFAPNAVLETRGVTHPSDQLDALIARSNQKYKRMFHVMTGTTLDLEDDRASGVTNCIAHHISHPVNGEHINQTMYVIYHDKFIRTDRGWLFEDRRGIVVFSHTSIIDFEE